MKDWEILQSRMHMHGNARHARPTPRMLDEPPVFQRFAPVEDKPNVPLIIVAIVGFCVLLSLRYLIFP